MCEEQTVSLVDVVQEDDELQEEASAVLAGSDSERCSYPQGYVKRQALYACNTCTPKGGQAAGVCLACSYKCHEGHDLFELYTKRNFRCDCGNGKFADVPCKLFHAKDDVNGLNKYSHNFFGEYCTCRRPYPDPEDQVDDEMIQCVLCEDWLHGRHLGCDVPDCVELREMICESCMNTNAFLWSYAARLAVPGAAVESDAAKETGADAVRADEEDDATEPSRKRVRVEEGEPSCGLKALQSAGAERVGSGAVFWRSGWRSRLCRCDACQASLSAAGLSFLLDESDTVLAYEKKGESEEGGAPGHDPLMSALDNLNRVQQLEIIHGYNDMKSELKDFLQGFVAEGKVVTSDDIRQFFERQHSRKRRQADGRFHCA
ncbi:putative E3 ubiquitin-protein ligase UBR7 [Phyllopteryx taeniolatus]|uniref:putative E3 ubiquitin-protein ligase UBR7 n=1 Tax=Phyllopteryx taeniolatus TaxID=161469 RepID=UPI002AD39306|nr:putative E3 ubiquitin-protein ligase UBR7 [Phyllopteryx taeniolatus]XP_061609448.1 putative E3 ubiquitin-protein ligase UBR7 [Phyllopteryx taeniolatus]XP_061609449.1 putative E3 ubiquitin-protein ligase UBR7 [Phyllopteryx taeniolatus]XP_061609450.1 putative E3 ubiquitin-protein ligase UBR7 [Phyllopteryx taeniolatus]